MRFNIETLDIGIWIVVILPAFALIGLIMGYENALFLIILTPFVIIIKNDLLERRLSWKPDYSVGIASLDKDHQVLLELMVQMFRALRGIRSKEKAHDIIDELLKYTEYHFGREEGLMAKHEYPGLDRHVEEHEAMKRKMAEFQEDFEVNSSKVSRDIFLYLQNWLIDHITVTDKQYTDFLTGKGEH